MEPAMELMIPILGILSGPLIVWIIFHYINKGKMETQKTIQAMIQSGQQIPPEILESLDELTKTTPEEKKEKDLRWGVIFTAIGVALMLAAVPAIFNGQWDDIWDGAWFVMIFLAIGIARLVLWKLSPVGNDSDKA